MSDPYDCEAARATDRVRKVCDRIQMGLSSARKVHLETTLPISPEQYLRSRNTSTWRELQMKYLNHKACELMSERVDPSTNTITEVMCISPSVEVPSVVRSFLCEGGLQITETRKKPADPGDPPLLPHVSEFISTNNVTDHVWASGTITVDADESSPSLTRLILDAHITVNLPSFIRPTIERSIIRNIEQGYEIMPLIVHDYVKSLENGLEEDSQGMVAEGTRRESNDRSSAGTSDTSFASANSTLGSTSTPSNGSNATTPLLHSGAGDDISGMPRHQVHRKRLQLRRKQMSTSAFPLQHPHGNNANAISIEHEQRSCVTQMLSGLGWCIFTICCCRLCGLMKTSSSPAASQQDLYIPYDDDENSRQEPTKTLLQQREACQDGRDAYSSFVPPQ